MRVVLPGATVGRGRSTGRNVVRRQGVQHVAAPFWIERKAELPHQAPNIAPCQQVVASLPMLHPRHFPAASMCCCSSWHRANDHAGARDFPRASPTNSTGSVRSVRWPLATHGCRGHAHPSDPAIASAMCGSSDSLASPSKMRRASEAAGGITFRSGAATWPQRGRRR